MFIDFFYHLRAHKIPVSTTEFLDLLKVLDKEVSRGEIITPKRLYLLARHCLIKDIKYFDRYDIAFSEVFAHVLESGSSFKEQLEKWLENAHRQDLSEHRKLNALKIPPEDLIKELEKRIKQQKERHDGGNKWIGTGGTSPFGHSGYNPGGLRVGGDSQNKSAMAVLGKRDYRDYRTDQTINVRQIKLALKQLRLLSQKGRPKMCIDQSIRRTCDNGGEVEIAFKRERKNTLKVILLMDIGGSMTPHSRRVEKLFSAAHQVNHFKEFKAYYFHNIVYDHLYHTHHLDEAKATLVSDLYKRYGPETRVIVVGDASMAPYELFQMNGQTRHYYDYFGQHSYPLKNGPVAIDRLREFIEHYPHSIWLNPYPSQYWSTGTIKVISEMVAMYCLSLDGLKQGLQRLV